MKQGDFVNSIDWATSNKTLLANLTDLYKISKDLGVESTFGNKIIDKMIQKNVKPNIMKIMIGITTVIGGLLLCGITIKLWKVISNICDTCTASWDWLRNKVPRRRPRRHSGEDNPDYPVLDRFEIEGNVDRMRDNRQSQRLGRQSSKKSMRLPITEQPLSYIKTPSPKTYRTIQL
jgi:hypothetical protein